MFESMQRKKLIIVCTEDTRKYGNYLLQLISLKDDTGERVVGLKDGSVDAVVWLERDYEANRVELSGNTKVIFIGNSKTIKDECANMDSNFENYGMHFLSLGSQAMMYVDKKLLKKNEYSEFLNFCQNYQKSYEQVKLNILKSANPVIKWVGVASLGFVTAPLSIYGLVSGKAAKEKINDQQYSFLIYYAYIELLPDFMER